MIVSIAALPRDGSTSRCGGCHDTQGLFGLVSNGVTHDSNGTELGSRKWVKVSLK